jgi:hypothetical protein
MERSAPFTGAVWGTVCAPTDTSAETRAIAPGATGALAHRRRVSPAGLAKRAFGRIGRPASETFHLQLSGSQFPLTPCNGHNAVSAANFRLRDRRVREASCLPTGATLSPHFG